VLAVLVCRAVVAPGIARADPRPVSVTTRGCSDLDGDELERLLGLELVAAGLRDPAVSLWVEFACEGSTLRITAKDPLTSKQLVREIPAPAAGTTGREREVALAASQLFLASWLELLLKDRPPPVAEGVTPEAVQAAEEAASEAVEVPGPRVDLGVGVAGRLRSLGQLLPTGRAELRGGGWIDQPGPGIFGRVAFEFGRTVRDIGEVDLYAVLGGVDLAWRVDLSGRWALDLGLSLAGGYAQLAGREPRVGIVAERVGGFTGEGGAFIGPVLLTGSAVIALVIEGGYAVPTPIGRVEDGGRVTPGGAWVGAGLRFDYCFR
jgi:hypothetical protein